MPIQIDLGPGSPKAAEKKVAPRGPVVGIDLGTTNSLIAIAMGSQARVIQDSEGRALTPSVVRINEQSGRVETIGNIAKADKAAHFASTTFSIKRFMGKSFEEVSHEAHQLPFELVGDSASGQVQIRVGEKNFSPIELSAEILKHLKARAEETLGEKVERAVVTVPAYFDDAQRAATKAAGRLAGLDVLRILNEPTAAALAYGWDNQRPGRIAVYDLGGGTFDISVLRIEENVFEVLSTSGDTHLGGDDFDWALANWALAGYAAKNPNARPKDENEQKKLVGELLTEAERVKLELSAGTNAEFSLRGEKFSISRADAEKLWDPLIERTLAACRQALADARIEAKDLKDVLLVGGSTRVPRVRERVKEFFGREPNTTLNPDEAVALGAALQAENLGTRATEHLLLDVIPLSLGIETMGGTVSKLIPRNSTIPCEARENFTNHADKQTAFDFHIVQGERELIKDCRSLARFKLRGLEPAPAGFHRIEVLFRIDANGILNVRARDLRSGKAQEIEVKPSFGISEDELTRMLEASIDNAESDMAARQLVDLKMEAQTVIAAGEKAVKISGHMVSTDELGEIRARLIDLKNAAHGSSLETLQRSLDTFNEVTRELAELQVNQALQSSLEGKDTRKL